MTMRALTIREPWASALVYGCKRIENRTWVPPEVIRGEMIALHTSKQSLGSKQVREDAAELREAELFDFDTERARLGHIIGVAQVAGVVVNDPNEGTGWWWFTDETRAFAETLAVTIDQRWLIPGCVGWILSEVHELATPVPARGMLGCWKLSPDIEAAVGRSEWRWTGDWEGDYGGDR